MIMASIAVSISAANRLCAMNTAAMAESPPGRASPNHNRQDSAISDPANAASTQKRRRPIRIPPKRSTTGPQSGCRTQGKPIAAA